MDGTPREHTSHGHSFGQELKRPGEDRTRLVIGLTGGMMAVEVTAGLLFGSMALLADGLHMASHTVALGINLIAYAYARRHAGDTAYSFGTGKVNALGGFSGAILLAVFAVLMAYGSIGRLIEPVEIVFDQAIAVAVVGLAVNGVSALILGVSDHDRREHRGHDHNLRSAYLHVMADALTSALAIAALLAAKYVGLVWMDPLMGIVGAVLVSRWSFGLLRATSAVLLDRQGPQALEQAVRRSLESDGASEVTDLHLWSIGPGIYAAIAEVTTSRPAGEEEYRARLPEGLGLAHVSIVVRERAS
jgi:cation diffusion facilitator family transporter